MSYIDITRPTFIGYLAGYPVYQPSSTIQAARNSYSFGCSPSNLVLGGGSGEHPALVVHEFDFLAAHYLLQCMDLTGLPLEKTLSDELEDFLTSKLEPKFSEAFEFCGWSVEQFATFAARCKADTHPRNYDAETDSSIEHWLAYSFGEYAWLHQPGLFTSLKLELYRKFPGISSLFNDPCYPNLLAIPQKVYKP